MQAQAENTTLIDFDAEEWQALPDIAKRRGWSDITSYLRRLIHEDADAHNEETPFYFENSDREIEQSIRQGFREALRGEGQPLEEFLAELRAESDEE
jgi:hypothetical protein